MFGLSIGKLLVFAAVVAAVWIGWRKISAAGDMLQRRASQRSADAGRGPAPEADPETVDLVRDPKTGRYEPSKRD